jgi:DsbC/DsbD-like thiol-disulfide interchange protein
MKPTSIASALLVLALTVPAVGGETPWQEVAPDVSMRLITSDAMTEANSTWVALEIDMPQDTKTYWRVPGESGIPIQADFTHSRGVSGHTIAWPFPDRETDRGYLDHTYYGHVVLPIELEIEGDNGQLDAEITLGICSEICVPVTARFSHELEFSAPDTAQQLRIRQSLAHVPIAWDGENDPFGTVHYDPVGNTVTVEHLDDDIAPDDLIVEIAGTHTLFGVPKNGRADGTLDVPMLGRNRLGDLEGHRVQLTFMTDDGPYELFRVVEEDPRSTGVR